MSEEVILDKLEKEDGWCVKLQLTLGIPDGGWKYLKEYIELYAKESGWKVLAKNKKRWLELKARPN